MLGQCALEAGAQPRSATDPMSCIHEYAKNNDIPISVLTKDAFGQTLILERTGACGDNRFCGPYSIGANGVDECGKGDDLVLRSCREGW